MSDRNHRADDDAMLSALLDDALSEEEKRKLSRRLDDEPALARRLEELRRVDESLRGAYSHIADEPLPRQVVDRLLPPADVTPFRRPERSPRRFHVRLIAAAGTAMAAGFILAMIVLPRSQPTSPLQAVSAHGVVSEGSVLHDVLQTLPSGESRSVGAAWSASPRLTFLTPEDEPCRRVDMAGPDGGLETVSCRQDGTWKMVAIGFAPSRASASGEYRPATERGTPAIEKAIDALIDGSPLGREAESAWIGRDWEGALD